MAIRRLTSEWTARLLLTILVAGLFVAILAGRHAAQAVEVHAVMPERGGWLPGNLSAKVGVPLNLRLISDDVMHGFAVGRQTWPAVDVRPGQVSELTLTFDEPGSYTFYCTRWCGPNHWRMRGTIDVTGEASGPTVAESPEQPLYISLGLDIDAPHEVDVRFDQPPSAKRGEALDFSAPPRFRYRNVYLEQPPYELQQALRVDPRMAELSDADIWDLIAFLWQSQLTPSSVQLGQRLYAENCSACHGEDGDGEGVIAPSNMARNDTESVGGALLPPSDFTDAQQMLGANTALLQGKIIRGGMGTGMPYWGTIFTEEEIEALVDYIWTFQFPMTAGE
ncbi:MAG TPA: c-type cytochrome [candidate division Zixibacteria bacterium]|nr:c-type cytochrome [candidate division Zixibacteria bacterium]